MAGSLIDENPSLAYEHAKAAYRRAARIDIVREALGLTAYANEKYDEALRELRTYRRMSNDMSHVCLEADCERGLGRPERAIAYLDDIDINDLGPLTQVELALVLSGAYADMEEYEKGLAIIDVLKVEEFSDEMRAPIEIVRAERLRDLGRDDEAAQIESSWSAFLDNEQIEVYDEAVLNGPGDEADEAGDVDGSVPEDLDEDRSGGDDAERSTDSTGADAGTGGEAYGPEDDGDATAPVTRSREDTGVTRPTETDVAEPVEVIDGDEEVDRFADLRGPIRDSSTRSDSLDEDNPDDGGGAPRS